ncbi:MAG: flagellar basal body rod C-terminal domain-containing protein [Nitrospinales bacterium]
MLNALSSAGSGLKTSARKLQSSANNVANVLTPGFKADRGVEASDVKSGAAAETSNVDLAKEAVDQITAVNAFKANANVIKAAEEMTGAILDIKG